MGILTVVGMKMKKEGGVSSGVVTDWLMAPTCVCVQGTRNL